MTLEDYLESKKTNKKEKKTNTYRESIIKRVLITTTLVLIILISCNISKNMKDYINKYVFTTNYNFSKLNKIYKKYFLDIKDKVIDKKESVSSNVDLIYYDKTDYMDGVKLEIDENYNVKLLESGLVVFIGEKEDLGNVIIVQQSNGIDVTYGFINQSDCKIYDYIEKGKIIGTANKELYLKFEKEGETLDYNTYIK